MKLRIDQYLLEKVEGSVRLYTARSMILWTLQRRMISMVNLSQEKRKRMIAFLKKIKEEHKDDDETLIALDEIENELNSKKYGLVW